MRSTTLTLSWTSLAAFSLLLGGSADAQEPVEQAPGKTVDIRSQEPGSVESSQGTQPMFEQAEVYEVLTESDALRQLKLHPRPLIRFNNLVSGVPDGIIVMWTDGVRPAVLAQVFQLKDKRWLHEVQSMAANPLTMRDTKSNKVVWHPREPGLTWQRLEDVVVRGETDTIRLRQMKKIAADFTAVDKFQVSADDTARSPYSLRLLPNPLYRYSDDKRGVVDGAVFAFVHGTDPEMFLLLEAKKTEGGAKTWRYALAPMTCWAIDAQYNGQPVWSVPERLNKSTIDGNYHVWVFDP
ncbi:MAG: hypothetical protein MI861_23050 [Pirellulales bacterium]|nr:hypothetical protein [Pirellulales bacterium]